MIETATAKERPEVSVVVCTLDRADCLRRALDTLIRLETADACTYEVLVVDNGSTDGTASTVEQVASTSSVPVRRAFEPRRGIPHARNRGIDEARGEWIAFFDDDQIADRSWLLELMRAAAAKNVRCVGGAVRLELPSGQDRVLAPTCRMLLGATCGAHSTRPYSPSFTPGAGNLLVHRSVFREVGGFDVTLPDRGEDTDLFLRMHRAGIAAWFTPAAVVGHVIPAERLADAYLLDLSSRMPAGLAEDERRTSGPLYGFVWVARLGQTVFVLLPRLLLARLVADPEALLGARCRLVIAKGYLLHGLRLIFRESSIATALLRRRRRAS